MNRGTYKLSTIFSFKGWETPVLFLIIETGTQHGFSTLLSLSEKAADLEIAGYEPTKFSDELVYTGLSRCKGKLYIINIDYKEENQGNNRYDSFFTSLPETIITHDVHTL